MHFIWRFYTAEDGRWKWQRLSIGKEVLAESPATYADYDRCLANAKNQGYEFLPSQPKLRQERSR